MLFHDTLDTSKKKVSKIVETCYTPEVCSTLYAAVQNICLLCIYELLLSLTLFHSFICWHCAFRAAPVSSSGVSQSLCFLYSWVCVVLCPWLGSLVLLSSRRFSLPQPCLPWFFFLISYCFTYSWILCLKNEQGPIFLFFLQWWHIPLNT